VYQQLDSLPIAGAEDMTQRKANPWFVRATSTSAQCSYPIADYCAKTLQYKRIATIADDFAYGHESIGGFQKVFEDAGGTVVQKLFSPLNAPDYGSYIAQIKPDVDAVFLGFAGSNGFRFFKQYNEYGMKKPITGGMVAFDEVAVRNMGDYAVGAISSCWYTAQSDNAINKRFVAAYRADNGYDPGQYASGTYLYGEVLGAAIEALNGRVEDKQAFIKALRGVRAETLRGPIRFDEYGNVVGNVYIRKVEKKDGRLVNTNIYTYKDVSQFWTYPPEEFLRHPVFSRDWPPAKNLEM
jgi:branched-chain amino acid transport system substrate-binding protein